MKNLLPFFTFVVFAILGFFLRPFARRFERWVERTNWVRVDSVLTSGCVVFFLAAGLYLAVSVVIAAIR